MNYYFRSFLFKSFGDLLIDFQIGPQVKSKINDWMILGQSPQVTIKLKSVRLLNEPYTKCNGFKVGANIQILLRD